MDPAPKGLSSTAAPLHRIRRFRGAGTVGEEASAKARRGKAGQGLLLSLSTHFGALKQGEAGEFRSA